jgi:hypothetical protein
MAIGLSEERHHTTSRTIFSGHNRTGIANQRPSAAFVLKAKMIWIAIMIRKLKSGKYRLYSRKLNPMTGKRRNLGTFESKAAALKHERAVQFFKRRG